MDLINCKRRSCKEVTVGESVRIGGENPIVVQSMTSTSTNDIASSIEQIRRITEAGATLVRLTAQGVREAEALAKIRPQVNVPLVADIHFNPRAALAAAEAVDKVRINPGNFCRPGAGIEEALLPLLAIAKRRKVALRIGVNHGSLSPEIMERYGDTPEGMVESAMQFIRMCAKHDFHDIVVSIKASNTVVMVRTVRLLVQTMAKENLEYPLHLGVTEAGDGEDGRVKSAVGIGTLLYQGIGDTIRVSLSEDPEKEVPVARTLLAHIGKAAKASEITYSYANGYNPIMPERLASREVGGIGGETQPIVWGHDKVTAPAREFNAASRDYSSIHEHEIIILSSSHSNQVGELQAARHAMIQSGINNPVVMKISYDASDPDLAIKAAADFGALLLNGHQDGIFIDAPGTDTSDLSLSILQAARLRFSKTEFISCPSCGRTMFDLQQTLKAVKGATSHLKGLKIGVMGCIVNGPGEMADADYGYVGAGVGRISLYRKKECVERNLPQEEAIEHLINLIKANGEWQEPSNQ